MWIDIEDAVRIYARMLRARLGSIRGAKAALEVADHLRAKADWSGVKACEAVAAELASSTKVRQVIKSKRLAARRNAAASSA
jgi:hypothetical protein